MRRAAPTSLLAAVILAAAASLGAGCDDDDGGGRSPAGEAQQPRPAPRGAPNVVVVMTDDQDARSLSVMRRTRRLLGRRGATFTNAIASYPLCCPSRTTLLTGQYAHNHGAKGNFPQTDGGGYVRLREPERTLPAWLRAAGYRTAHVGKWASAPGPEEPPGWDRWLAITEQTSARYYDFALHDPRGGELRFGSRPGDYHTDVISGLAAGIARRWAGDRRPFLLSVAYLAPHLGAGRDDRASRRCAAGEHPEAPPPAPRHATAFAGRRLPRPPSFDEPDVGDKPAAVVRGRRLESAEIRALERDYGCRLAALLAVDEGVGRMAAALRSAGELEDTLFLFTSDNGYLLGEHRVTAQKNLPYEEALRVPLLIAGPGVPAGVRVAEPAANIDLAPTIIDLAGVEQPPELRRPADGRSLVPPARGGRRHADRAVLIEGRYDTEEARDGGFEVLSYVGVRTRRYLFVEHRLAQVDDLEKGAASPLGAGERIAVQLYDLERDPFQLDNRARHQAYREPRKALAGLLARLLACEGRSCRVEASVPPPG